MFSELKSHLKGIASKFVAVFKTRQLPLSSNSISYHISSTGLVWSKVTEEQAHTGSQLGVAEVEALTVELFEQVSYNYCSVLLVAELVIVWTLSRTL